LAIVVKEIGTIEGLHSENVCKVAIPGLDFATMVSLHAPETPAQVFNADIV
jgi:hypothetical protein